MGYSSSCGQRGQSRLDWCFACGSACRSNLASTFSWKQIRVAWRKLHEMGSELWCWNARKWRLQKIQIQRRGKCTIKKILIVTYVRWELESKKSGTPPCKFVQTYIIIKLRDFTCLFLILLFGKKCGLFFSQNNFQFPILDSSENLLFWFKSNEIRPFCCFCWSSSEKENEAVLLRQIGALKILSFFLLGISKYFVMKLYLSMSWFF